MNFSKFFIPVLPLLAILLSVGCVREVIVPEVMQQPIGAPLYTQCNIWFEDPQAISCMNYQRGRVLPLGSEVTPVYASQGELIFKDASGVEYHIQFDPEEMMIPVQEYIRRVFTLLPPDELLKDVSPEHRAAIAAATVLPGMSRQEVIFSFGYPPPGRTPALTNSSYLYYQGKDRTFRVNFKGNEVSKVIAPQN